MSDIDFVVNTNISNIYDNNKLIRHNGAWSLPVAEITDENRDFIIATRALMNSGFVTERDKSNYNVLHGVDFKVKKKVKSTGLELLDPFDTTPTENIIALDHILVNPRLSIKDFIHSYDFDFCKVGFTMSSSALGKLWIANTKSIITMTSEITEDSLKPQIAFQEMYLNVNRIKISFDDRLNDRLKKYRKRGFTIIDKRSLK